MNLLIVADYLIERLFDLEEYLINEVDSSFKYNFMDLADFSDFVKQTINNYDRSK